MKLYTSIALLSSALILATGVFGQSLEFSKSTVDSNKPGDAPVKAMMVMTDGKKHSTMVKLQENVSVNDLTDGSLIYLKEHNEIYQVTSISTDNEGKKVAEIKSTNLFTAGKKMGHSMKNNQESKNHNNHNTRGNGQSGY